MYFVAQDVTRRKEVEIKHDRVVNVMRAIVDSVAGGICVVDSVLAAPLFAHGAATLLDHGSATV
jgi:hypothetical protein